MTMGQNHDSTRAEIAARYGIPLDQVAPVQVIEKGVSGLPDPTISRAWGEYKDAIKRISMRQRKFERVARKEFAPPPEPVIEKPAPVTKVAPVAKERKKVQRRPEFVQRDGNMRQMVDDGMTLEQIASRLNMKPKTAAIALAKLGLKAYAPPKPPKPPKVSNRKSVQEIMAGRAEYLEKFRALAAQGYGSRFISQELGIKQEAARKFACRNGIKLGTLGRKKVEYAPAPEINAQEVIEMFQSGVPLPEIAKQLKRRVATIREVVDAAGISRRKMSKVTQETLSAVADHHAKGLHDTAIAAEVGISRTAVQRALATLGLKSNQHKPKMRDANAAEAVRELYYDKGMSIARIGAELNIPKSRAHRLLSMARAA